MAERPEDLNLPLAVVSRIIKESLPDHINVSKEARQAISKAASVFVLYATSCANNFALKGKRKTLAANDIFQAMEEMEFDRFVPELKKSWESFTNEKKSAMEKKKQQKESKENQESASEKKAQNNANELAEATNETNKNDQKEKEVATEATAGSRLEEDGEESKAASDKASEGKEDPSQTGEETEPANNKSDDVAISTEEGNETAGMMEKSSVEKSSVEKK